MNINDAGTVGSLASDLISKQTRLKTNVMPCPEVAFR